MDARKRSLSIFISVIFLAASCNKKIEQPQVVLPHEEIVSPSPAQDQTVDFAEINSTFKFSGRINTNWKVEYIPSIESINIYDPSVENKTFLEQSQIFIRYFRSNDFLTLQTVDILSRADAKVALHPAVRYEIKKKTGVPNFPSQPSWRSEQHKLIDIRLSESNPSLFYVFANNPSLSSEEFDKFIASLKFDE